VAPVGPVAPVEEDFAVVAGAFAGKAIWCLCQNSGFSHPILINSSRKAIYQYKRRAEEGEKT
jgi:hypothetical protein